MNATIVRMILTGFSLNAAPYAPDLSYLYKNKYT